MPNFEIQTEIEQDGDDFEEKPHTERTNDSVVVDEAKLFLDNVRLLAGMGNEILGLNER